MGGGEGDTSRSWTSGKGGMKLRANAGVKISAEEEGRHLPPRKSTVELKAAFPTLARPLGLAPTSSHSGCSGALDPSLWGSLCASGPLSISHGGRLRLPRPQGAFSSRFPPHTGPGAPAAPPTWPPPQPAPAARPSRCKPAAPPGGGVSASPPRTHPLRLCCSISPDTPLSASASTSWGLRGARLGARRGEGFGRRQDARGLPGARGGEEAAEPGAAGPAAAEGGGEWGGAGGQAVGEGGVLRGGERRSDFLRGWRSAELPPSPRARCSRPAPRPPETGTGPW